MWFLFKLFNDYNWYLSLLFKNNVNLSNIYINYISLQGPCLLSLGPELIFTI